MVRQIAAQRQQQIVRLVDEHGIVSVRELCQVLGVSDMTVRRDFQTLVRQGVLLRTHGGAVSLARPNGNPTYATHDERQPLQAGAKIAIGDAAAALVADGDTLFLSSGTTARAFARALRQKRRLTIVTDSIHIVDDLLDCEELTLVSTGGVASEASGSFTGSLAEATIARLRGRWAFLGTTGVSPEGFSNNSLDAAALHRRMIDSATDTYVLADHTKFDRTSLTITAPLADVTGVVTDAATPPASLAWLRDAGLDVIVAAV